MSVKNIVRMSMLCGLLSFPITTYAGPGTIVFACVYLQTKPLKPITFHFKISGTHCMTYSGATEKDLVVHDVGPSCVEIGYIEKKASSSGGDVCATDENRWVLGYTATNHDKPETYTGSTGAKITGGMLWWPNSMELYAPSPGTTLCTSDAGCDNQRQDWDVGKQGPVVIQFRPGTVKTDPPKK